MAKPFLEFSSNIWCSSGAAAQEKEDAYQDKRYILYCGSHLPQMSFESRLSKICLGVEPVVQPKSECEGQAQWDMRGN